MKYITINTDALINSDYLIAEDDERSAWLSLNLHCAERGLGNTIKDCLDWSDRKWMALCKTSKMTISKESTLWRFHGSDLVINDDLIEKVKSTKTRHECFAIARNRGDHTTKEWETMKAAFGNRCACCGMRGEMTKDHVIPVSDTERSSNSIDNIQPLCQSCNSQKGVDDTDYRGGFDWRGITS